jgi:fumarate reductase flavoprotein subunit
MAIDAGAASNRSNSLPLAAFWVDGLPSYLNENGRFTNHIGFEAPYALWVNEKGERFLNEDFNGVNPTLGIVPTLRNKRTFFIFDSEKMDRFIAGREDAAKELKDGIAYGSIIKSDTLADLSSQAGFDSTIFDVEVSRYNESAMLGEDRDYGKNPEALQAFVTGPFYAVEIIRDITTTIGSIKTNRDFSAIDVDGNGIKGLYAVGVEGAMLWANVYTINISGGCNANSVYSGRIAAKHAAENCL